MRNLKLILALPTIMLFSSTVAADRASVDVRVTGQVPISCSASLSRSVVEISAREFKIGQLDRFCNTPHMVTMNTISGISGTLRLEGQSASTITGQAVINPFSSAKRGRADIFLSGVTNAQADQIAASLSVSLAPSGT
jgi:hypothetical protein